MKKITLHHLHLEGPVPWTAADIKGIVLKSTSGIRSRESFQSLLWKSYFEKSFVLRDLFRANAFRPNTIEFPLHRRKSSESSQWWYLILNNSSLLYITLHYVIFTLFLFLRIMNEQKKFLMEILLHTNLCKILILSFFAIFCFTRYGRFQFNISSWSAVTFPFRCNQARCSFHPGIFQNSFTLFRINIIW